MTQAEQLLAERDRLLLERDQLRELVAKQVADLSAFRREMEALRERHVAVQEQFAEIRRRADRLGLTTPARN